MKFILLTGLIVFSTYAAADNILLLGDSLTCGPFGGLMQKRLTAEHNDVTIYCESGTTPTHWYLGKGIKAYKCHTCSGSQCDAFANLKIPDGDAKDADKNFVMPLCDPDGNPPSLEKILQEKKFAKVLVVLGTNPVNNHKAAVSPNRDGENDYKNLAKFLNAKKIPCTWIGPPHIDGAKPAFNEKSWEASYTKNHPDGVDEAEKEKAKQKAIQSAKEHQDANADYEKDLGDFYDSLKTNTAGCGFVDSRDFTANPSPNFTISDGVHRTVAAVPQWVDGVMSRLDAAAKKPEGDATGAADQ